MPPIPPAMRRRWLTTLRENAGMAFETLRGSLGRSFLTVLGVFIGVVIVTAVASVLNGLRDSVVKDVESFGTNNVYVHRFPLMQGPHPSREVRVRKEITLDDALALEGQCPSVDFVSPGLEYWGIAIAKADGESMDGPAYRGAFPEAERVGLATVKEGRFFVAAENEHRVPVAVIGHAVAEALFPNRRAVGRKLEVAGNRFEVIGVLEKQREGPFGERNREDAVILVPYFTFKKSNPWAEDHFIALTAKPGKLSEAVEEVTEVLRRRRKVRWDEPNDFEVSTASSIIQTFDQIIFGVMAVMFMLSSVAFLVGGVGVMNIMLASVKERTAEIGMRKAIGARRRDIAWQFLIEAMVLTGAGGLAGILFTDFLAFGVKAWWSELPMATPLWARLAGFSGSVSVGLIFGIWPAVKAARLDPIESLRYE